MVVQKTINHGVALFIGFILAVVIEEAVAGQFEEEGGILSVLADNIVALYLVLVVALFATQMAPGRTGGSPM